MTASGVTNVQQSAESPALPADFGIVIRAEPYPPRAVGRLAVHGAYHLPRSTRRARVAACLERVNLTAKRNVLAGTLSRGMTQRLVLAKTLLRQECGQPFG